MKAINRVMFVCFKKLPCGILERFSVIVMAQDEAAAKKKYESEGYTVR